jgi:hypothetical protein
MYLIYVSDAKPQTDETDLKALNRVLKTVLLESPITKRRTRSNKSIEAKCSKIGRKSLAVALGEEKVVAAIQGSLSLADSRIIARLVSKYHETKDNKTKQQILTVAAAADLSIDRMVLMEYVPQPFSKIKSRWYHSSSLSLTPLDSSLARNN